MKKKIICGIYKITSPSGRVYIGESENIHSRWKDYKKLRCKSQPKLYNSLKEYRVENHTFEILEECPFEELLCRERYWQDFYDVTNEGLNCLLTQCGEKKRVPSEETIEKIRNNCFRHEKGINNPFSKKCYQYDLNGNFIKEWHCIQDVERELGFCNSLITRCMKGKTRTAHKFQWFYEYKGEIIEPIQVKSCPKGTRNPELLNNIKLLWEEDKSLTLREISEKLKVKYCTIRNLWQKHKEFISGSKEHRRKDNPSNSQFENIKKAQENLKIKRNEQIL